VIHKQDPVVLSIQDNTLSLFGPEKDFPKVVFNNSLRVKTDKGRDQKELKVRK
jgi:hypothetical protein